ncbi:MAG: hypothetical protein QG647_200 [Patescibacteria group bacterium]|nr:hypothetical protein [Patescibacteria group bacterium]
MQDYKINNDSGFTIIELLVSSIVIAMLAISVFSAYVALNSTALFARQKTIGVGLASNQIEYLKSLPYDDLAVENGAIQTANPLPNTKSENIDGAEYNIITSINYIDDAHDGCANYPNEENKNLLCRNLPSPSGSPTTDLNPADYKIANVKVYVNNKKVAELDTQIAARVAETDSTTGALVVRVIDASGLPISGALATVSNPTVSPTINLTDSTDSNGIAIFYGLKPDTGNDYQIVASKDGYSSLSSIKPAGGLSPNFSSQNIITQQSSSITMTINPKTTNSFLVENVDIDGTPIPNLKAYIKGGVKKYSDTNNTDYYYDNLNPTDFRPTSNANGLFTVTNLDPGNYYFCGDSHDQACQINSDPSKYLVAAVPYRGESQFSPIILPNYDASVQESSLFNYEGKFYQQKVRLYFSSNSSAPRITSLLNPTASIASGIHNFSITGLNMPCHETEADECETSVSIKNSSNIIPASCIYKDGSTTEISCDINLSGATPGQSNLILSANGQTINIPNDIGLLGGINVVP